jgi:small subunit ribosomal protein S10
MAAVTIIKLTGQNHLHIDQVAKQIKAICDNGGISLRGPIPLPTRRLVVPVRKAPDGEGVETYDHW